MAPIADEEAHLLGEDVEDSTLDYPSSKKRAPKARRANVLFSSGTVLGGILFLIGCFWLSWHLLRSRHLRKHMEASCTNPADGYTCSPTISHNWGQYSPYHLIPSEIPPALPPNCHITFAQLLSRHGARDPTLHKTALYAQTIGKIKSQVPASSLKGAYSFLASYTYNLGADQLTSLGRTQMRNSGLSFFSTYPSLSNSTTPFIRASSQQRVIESARLFADGFHTAKRLAGGRDEVADREYPYPITTISEASNSNNTLDHTGLCPAFEESQTGEAAQQIFASTFLPAIHARLDAALPAANLAPQDALSLMDLCPFETVAAATGHLSSFCALFTEAEWANYDYHQTLGKYHGSGAGSPFGPTQGVGWVNELIARLTNSSVKDETSVNHTLDASSATFPLGRKLYADFGHDNGMISIFAALGLYNSTPALEKGRRMDEGELKGFSASKTVPFSGRAVVEKMVCSEDEEGGGEWVRVVMNGRVLPLDMCGGDGKGRCRLEQFVEGLGFARGGGRWAECGE